MSPDLYGEVERLIGVELLQTRMARAIARKAGIRQGDALPSTPQVLVSFSAANSVDGYEIAYTASTPFPNSVIQPDLTDITRLRLLVNVVAGGGEGVQLVANGAGENISIELLYTGDILSAGEWVAVDSVGISTLNFTITAPGPGSVTVGLMQLQGI